MKMVTLASLRGAPGVTTTALLLAASTATERADAVVVEADLDGGVLAVRHGLGREPGLITFAAASEDDPGSWRHHAQNAGGVPALVGPDVPSACVALWRGAGDRISHRLVRSDGLAFVDAGRFRAPLPIFAASDLVLMVVRPIAEDLLTLRHHLPALTATTRGRVAAVVVGDGPYRRPEIQRDLGIGVMAELPEDPSAAAVVRTIGVGSNRLHRSRLGRAAAGLAATVAAAVTQGGPEAWVAKAS